MNRVQKLSAIGQSIWLDFIRRDFLRSGGLQALIEEGIVGVTSNPSIFEKAIAGSTDYDPAILSLAGRVKSTMELYETLAMEDITQAADQLLPVYHRTGGGDGYVSLEVSPTLANDTQGTIADARRLFKALNRPNIMIKVPATPAGIPAVETLIGEGININVTLIFSTIMYRQVVEAYIRGLETWTKNGGDPSKVASVASFFVSRVDTAVDKLLEDKGEKTLQGKIAIANAKIAYLIAQECFSGMRWASLASQGAREQRLLWASTGTKNPAYPDTLYVDELIEKNTVNTIPPETLEAYQDHGKAAVTLSLGLEEAQQQVEQLADFGIDLEQVTAELLDAGVAAFAKSFAQLLESIEGKRKRLTRAVFEQIASIEPFAAQVWGALGEMKDQQIMGRIWAHDHTVWHPEPTEITNRLGWLHTPFIMADALDEIYSFVDDVREAGYTHALLLGMGGSSLAPEVFQKTFGTAPGYLHVQVLDSTEPGAVRAFTQQLDPAKTLFIVSTKSGGTVETFSFFKYFYNWILEKLGAEEAGLHFAAITDPGSKLAEVADEFNFRAVFLNDPNIGGRYSALSFFGIVPAALCGVDVARLLENARDAAGTSRGENSPVDGTNQAAWLGAILGELAIAGRDKLTFFLSPQLQSFGDWVEQLIAESTGKIGRGILPVVGEPFAPTSGYGDDRLFVGITLKGDTAIPTQLDELRQAGHPVVHFALEDAYDLGGQYFLWEIATAVAGYRLGIQPFDQPNVESAKVLARQMVAAYHETGQLPQGEMAAPDPEILHQFLAQAQPGDYIAIQAYIQPSEAVNSALAALRSSLLEKTRLATTVGYGPRFLHSTGQLHKGDGGNGLFIQITANPVIDLPIPDEAGRADSAMSFGVLIQSQALGDYQALKTAQPPRRVIRFHLQGSDLVAEINALIR